MAKVEYKEEDLLWVSLLLKDNMDNTYDEANAV